MVNQNLEFYCRKYKLDNLINCHFREKTLVGDTWKIQYGISFDCQGLKYRFSSIEDMFTLGYTSNLLFRDSCYNCRYTKLERPADLTIGDFWKLMNTQKFIGHGGVSVVLTHTSKGELLLRNIKDKIIIEHDDLEQAIKGNPQLVCQTQIPIDIDKFRSNFRKYGLIKAVKIYNRKLIYKVRLYQFLKDRGFLSLVKSIKRKCLK
jgi:hypothetical protein